MLLSASDCMEVKYEDLGRMMEVYGNLVCATKEFRGSGNPPHKGHLARIILDEYLPAYRKIIPLGVQEHLNFDAEGLEKEIKELLE